MNTLYITIIFLIVYTFLKDEMDKVRSKSHAQRSLMPWSEWYTTIMNNNWTDLKKIFLTMFRDGWHLLSWLRSAVVSAYCTYILWLNECLVKISGYLSIHIIVTFLCVGIATGLIHEIFWRIDLSGLLKFLKPGEGNE